MIKGQLSDGNTFSRRRELEAASIVSKLIFGEFETKDEHGSPPSTYDFHFTLNSGETMALEVTATTPANVMTAQDVQSKLEWHSKTLKRDWSLNVNAASRQQKGTNLRQLNREIHQLISKLEEMDSPDGVDLIGNGSIYFEKPFATTLTRLSQLGVRHINSCGIKSFPIAQVQVGNSRLIENVSLNEDVERLAKSNSKKLKKASVDERHIFIWVDSTDSELFAQISLSNMPNEPPTIPEGINTVWLGLWSPGWTRFSNVAALWRVEQGTNWFDQTSQLWRLAPESGKPN